MKSLPSLLCKCHARVLLQEHEDEQKMVKDHMMQIDSGAGSDANKKEVKFDNLYDVLFNAAGHLKS